MGEKQSIAEQCRLFEQKLVGRRIVQVVHVEGHEDNTFGVVLNDGTLLYAERDNEGNGMGTLVHVTNNGEIDESVMKLYQFD